MVGEVASSVDVDKATEEGDNLEYARLQVRTLKSCNVRLKKGMKINGQILNIYMEEEQPNFLEGKCKFTYNHYASSNSVTSSESFVEGTNLSEKSVDEEGKLGEEELRWPEELKEGGKGNTPNKTKFSNEKEGEMQDNQGQEKGVSAYMNKAKELKENLQGLLQGNQLCPYPIWSTLHAKVILFKKR